MRRDARGEGSDAEEEGDTLELEDLLEEKALAQERLLRLLRLAPEGAAAGARLAALCCACLLPCSRIPCWPDSITGLCVRRLQLLLRPDAHSKWPFSKWPPVPLPCRCSSHG